MLILLTLFCTSASLLSAAPEKRFMDAVGSGLIKRTPLRANLDLMANKRSLDSIGSSLFEKKSLDSIGSSLIDKKSLDAIGSNLIERRSLDSIGSSLFERRATYDDLASLSADDLASLSADGFQSLSADRRSLDTIGSALIDEDKRSLDSIGSSLFEDEKRAWSDARDAGDFPLYKRHFDAIGSGLVRKRMLDQIGSGLVRKKWFDSVGSGLIKRPYAENTLSDKAMSSDAARQFNERQLDGVIGGKFFKNPSQRGRNARRWSGH